MTLVAVRPTLNHALPGCHFRSFATCLTRQPCPDPSAPPCPDCALRRATGYRQLTNDKTSIHFPDFPHFPEGSAGNKFQPPSHKELALLSSLQLPPQKIKKREAPPSSSLPATGHRLLCFRPS